MLENLGTEAHPKVFQEEKGHLLREIQDHQTFLDNTVQQFWDLEQATQAYRARASNMSDMREKIIIHENGMLIYVFS
jgi:DNA-binding transcriptional regulator PaaX